MSSFNIQLKMLQLCKTLKFIPDDLISLSQIEHHIPIEKQLDEYRELIEEIEKQTHFFSHAITPWSKNHAYTLDEYLLTLCQRKKNDGRKNSIYPIRPRTTAIEPSIVSVPHPKTDC
ncbi:hypothetical protein [Vibrio sp. OPT18]|uniref:hypothetical protein n=1 Tax=Vibrio sp. OPT18 TaxID=2778641 RepID=UPI00188095F0|nr:hypothetical protein [Vibrio sp. OPT18]MBE8574096.1 hypothetical protein [Vibrio sp. OPT18]